MQVQYWISFKECGVLLLFLSLPTEQKRIKSIFQKILPIFNLISKVMPIQSTQVN